MTYRWDFKKTPPISKINKLSKAINVNAVLSALLLQRGIYNYEIAEAFFRPNIENLHNPFLMKDMEKAVQRINMAFENQEKILIYGDYDVDGSTAVAMVFDFLCGKYPNIDYYIPDRYDEGYGISYAGIKYAIENKVDLIICLDCGIKGNDKIQHAKDNQIDFIICDHHTPGSSLPCAFAILDPKRKDCQYPFKELSGCGVGFKLLQALSLENHYPITELFNYLDLVAISIASDIVPIEDENRILTHFGLKIINSNPRIGVKALLKVAGLDGNINISNLVFGVGPRINAAGRIEHAKAAVDLLITSNPEAARKHAENVNNHNAIRKDFDSSITEEALSMIAENELSLQSKSTVLFKENWHKGVIGIVASRCIEKYYKPTIILTLSKDKITGSARSVDGFDLYEAISQCSDLLLQFGGHRYAAGLTLDEKNISKFKDKFESVVSNSITEEQLIPTLVVDHMLSFDQITFKFYSILAQMSPFGPGNMTPVFVSENVSVFGKSRKLKEKHLKFTACQADNETKMEVLGFGFGHHMDRLHASHGFKIAYTLEENNYKGVRSLQLFLKDIKFDE